jgi:hypothetical protein
VTQNHKEQEEKRKQTKKVKTYSIQELLNHESSDDEGYQHKTTTFFPWYQKGYKHISDQLDFTQ